jgi:hypothetical protein
MLVHFTSSCLLIWLILHRQEVWDDTVIKQEPEDEETIQDNGVCSER